VTSDLAFERLRGDPRYKAFLRKMNPSSAAAKLTPWIGLPTADGRGGPLRVEMTRSRTPAKPALSNRNIEICQRVMPGNDVLISSVESGLAEASRPR
jgi:hypothetical protein